MRIIGNIPHPKISINIFSMNDKYQIQFIAGNMEQTFKIAHSDVGGIDEIKKMIDDDFIEKTIQRFNEMYLSFKDAKDKVGKLEG